MNTSANTDSIYEKSTTVGERAVITKLLAVTLDSGYFVSVTDGTDWLLEQCNNATEIKSVLATTNQNVLRVYDLKGNFQGFFLLLWNMGSDKPINYYSENEICENIYNIVMFGGASEDIKTKGSTRFWLNRLVKKVTMRACD